LVNETVPLPLELGGIQADQGTVNMEEIITIDDEMHDKKEDRGLLRSRIATLVARALWSPSSRPVEPLLKFIAHL